VIKRKAKPKDTSEHLVTIGLEHIAYGRPWNEWLESTNTVCERSQDFKPDQKTRTGLDPRTDESKLRRLMRF
jgi:hypothetical protein